MAQITLEPTGDTFVAGYSLLFDMLVTESRSWVVNTPDRYSCGPGFRS
jgi:hypothetical protein